MHDECEPKKNFYMRYFKSMIFLALIFISAQTQAQFSKKYPGYETNHYQSLRYNFYRPAGYEETRRYPLIVYLHGSRDTVSRDLGWYEESVQKDNPSFVLAPKCEEPNQGWGNTWNEGHTIATKKTLMLIDSLIQVYPIDVNRLYIYGISMGGFGVFSILAKEPGKFAAGYAVCGGSATSAASKLLETPLWIFHGSDDDVVPVALSRDIYKEIVRVGGKKVTYTEYPGVKHNSWENVSREKELNTWLFSQQKDQTK